MREDLQKLLALPLPQYPFWKAKVGAEPRYVAAQVSNTSIPWDRDDLCMLAVPLRDLCTLLAKSRDGLSARITAASLVFETSGSRVETHRYLKHTCGPKW